MVDDVPAYVTEHQREFLRCDRCRRVFWPGSRLDGMRRLIAALEDAPLLGVLDDDDGITTDIRLLEPLVDFHQALEVQFVQHRVALMRGDLPAAQRSFATFAEWMRRHVSNENELVLPVYAAHPPEGGWERGAAPAIFEHDHQNPRAPRPDRGRHDRARPRAPGGRRHCGSAASSSSIAEISVDLCEHHDIRERRYLYPTLERILDERAKVELLERMVGSGPSAEVRL